MKQANVALSIKRGRIYGVERTLQGICSILDTFIFTINDWASYVITGVGSNPKLVTFSLLANRFYWLFWNCKCNDNTSCKT